MTLLLWCMTGYYLATKYQNLLSRIKDFRGKVQSHSLEHGTTDNVLYELVISESRKLLPDETKKN